MNKSSQSGNALFLILIAVALFAALSYAVTQSGRGGGDIDREQLMLKASNVLNYAATLRHNALRMQVLGTSPADMVFTASGSHLNNPCTSGENCLFAPEGGGAVALSPDPEICEAGQTCEWGIDTIADNWALEGVGTAAPDIALWLRVTEEFCLAFNDTLKLGRSIADDTVGADGINSGYPGETAFYHRHDFQSGKPVLVRYGLIAQ